MFLFILIILTFLKVFFNLRLSLIPTRLYSFVYLFHHPHHVVLSARISLTLSRHPFSIVHRYWDVFKAISGIGTELLYKGSRLSSNLCLSVCRSPQEHVTYELVPTSPAVSRMSSSSNWDSFRDGWEVAVQLLLSRVLLPGLVQYSSQHSCVITIKLLLHLFC